MSGHTFPLSPSWALPNHVRAIPRRVLWALEVWRTRRILAELDARQLKDIGISRGEAQAEIARAPWDVAQRRTNHTGSVSSA